MYQIVAHLSTASNSICIYLGFTSESRETYRNLLDFAVVAVFFVSFLSSSFCGSCFYYHLVLFYDLTITAVRGF